MAAEPALRRRTAEKHRRSARLADATRAATGAVTAEGAGEAR
ncbi:hypothetical protein [Streptomyces sp. E2N166]|nr:hypothetical protein [Streptomyces sp. E2N166]